MRKVQLRVTSDLPSRWNPKGSVLESDIALTPGSTLRAKVIVFQYKKDLYAFWKHSIGHSLGRKCSGAVNGLHLWAEGPNGERRMNVDRRYFCVIGLVDGHLDAEILAHEAVHAAFAYSRRKARSWWDEKAAQMDEEAIAYPAGIIAESLAGIAWKLLGPD